ncbi:methyltransferase domain-containing protein [Lichenihabitans sp. Uapishka_5]|uniref:methyltransferase domain-containing protein n=1 Tax=Lichenihabitans sp. Uapishka_5 TaxID=3037302 RepID=UPI0029E80379|nr:methyltransferase domain-containing protein [Lichenihabitans sp. Uapishka_5]MDX7952959.1 methyltransferase domain-containing protein [Lichenihabitans sp. Uapishka_5]
MPQPASIPLVFDRSLVRRRLARSLVRPQADFLFDRARDDMLDRLLPVQRAFSMILELGAPRAAAAQALRHANPAASVIQVAPVAAALGRGGPALVADPEALPFGPERFDLAVSLMALHSVNDLPGALVQVRRSLKPDGLFLAAMLGGQSLQELRIVLAEAEAEITGGASPRVAPFTDLRDLGHLLQRTGFALPVTDLDKLTVRYGSMFGLLADLRAMGLTNALMDRARRPTPRRLLLRAAELYAARFADPDGRLRATFDLVWLSGWAPHESQQKPLRPGSAKMRLADALGAQEQRIDLSGKSQ